MDYEMQDVGGEELIPRLVVEELDRYIISQNEAKRAVAVALRNRWRRLRVPGEMRDEITPKNILMIGPTGVGKTEIARRLAKLASAPFVKVEASKFTEVGYVGRDVESIVRDLVEASSAMVREEERRRVKQRALALVEDQLLQILLPNASDDTPSTTREKLRELLREGKLDERIVEIETTRQPQAHLEVLGPPGMAEIEGPLKDLFSQMVPKQRERKKLPVKEAREALLVEQTEQLINPEAVAKQAVIRAEQSGIVFIDEIDKICGKGAVGKSPDVSREGVQRDLLPIVEGCTVQTKYGPVRTDHVLFIASGAFHFSKPSELMPEFQGRFPIRVELKSLSAEHFVRILTEPKNALLKQYVALLKTEGVDIEFSPEAVSELAYLTAEVNSTTENIGARRLHTILEKLLEELSFSAPEIPGQKIVIDQKYVHEKLSDIVKNADLSHFIL